MNKKFKLSVLPLFVYDLNEITHYIKYNLQNPIAAEALIDDVESAILERLPNCDSFAPYPSLEKTDHPYYRIGVHNYSIFYVVIGDVMEVRRIVYSKRDIVGLFENSMGKN